MRIVDEQLLDEFRGPGICDWCKKRVTRREAHHVHSRGAGRLDIRVNVAGLCAAFSGGDNCHAAVHQGHITRHDLLAVVAARENTTQDAIEAEVWRLRRAPKQGQGGKGCQGSRKARRTSATGKSALSRNGSRRAWPKRRLRWWKRPGKS